MKSLIIAAVITLAAPFVHSAESLKLYSPAQEMQTAATNYIKVKTCAADTANGVLILNNIEAEYASRDNWEYTLNATALGIQAFLTANNKTVEQMCDWFNNSKDGQSFSQYYNIK